MSTLTSVARPETVSTTSPYAKYGVLVGALMIQLILGTVYGYSIFWEPLERTIWPQALTQAQAAEFMAAGTPAAAAAMVVPDDAALKQVKDTRRTYLTYSFAICILAFAVTMIFAGRLQDLIGPRYTALIGGVAMALGFLVAGQMNHRVTFLICHALLAGAVVLAVLLAYHAVAARLDKERFPILQYMPFAIMTFGVIAGVMLGNEYLGAGPADRLFLLWATIGLLAGMGIGFGYVCPIAALVKWFPHHKGLMSGIAVAGFGLGAFVFSYPSRFAASTYIQEHGITSLFNVHALITLLAIGIGAMLLRNPPAGHAPRARKAAAVAGGDLTWQETLRTGRFYIIWFMFFSGAMAGLLVIGIIKPFANDQLTSAAGRGAGLEGWTIAQMATLTVGILSIFNAIGRIFWGLVSDRIGRTLSLVLMFTLEGLTMLSLARLDSFWLLVIGAASTGFNYGGCFALFPSLTADLFGSKNLGANYGWVFTSYGVAGVVGIWAGGLALAWWDSYFAAFALSAGLCFLSAILALVLGQMLRQRIAA